MGKQLGCDVDWSKAPEGTVFYAEGYFRDLCNFWDENDEVWVRSLYTREELLEANDYEPKPEESEMSEERKILDKLQENARRIHNPPKTSIQFLDEVKHVQSERAAEYEQDGGERSFAKISAVFNTYTGKDLVPSDIALILEILKNVRFYSQDGYHRDSVVDKISYGSLWAELVTEERE